jgi:SAM-dependent methyltransferase
MVLFLAEQTSLFDGAARRLLHIAPEQALAGVWATRAPNVRVVTMDLTAPSVSVHTDITRMPFPDASFDAIICSHVLEHIPEEQAALRELRRVLRPDGWALVVVPLMLNDRPTYEDSTITTAQGRLAAFGQEDHVRTYGTDAELRVARSGFDVRTIHHYDHISGEDVAKYGLVAEPFFVCTHLSAAPNININRRVSQQSE